MRHYPLGTRCLFWAHRLTGIGVHEIYTVSLFRWACTALDRLDGKLKIWPR